MEVLWGLYKQYSMRTFDLIKDDSNLFQFKFSIDGGIGHENRKATSKQARALADAIYKELGLGWLPYPENKPRIDHKIYTITIDPPNMTPYVDRTYWEDGNWDINHVVAFMNDLAPYQPEDSHDQ